MTVDTMTGQEDFYSRINKICNFFLRSPGSGLLFCAASDYRVITTVNQLTKDRLVLENFRIETIKVNPADFDSFYTLLEDGMKLVDKPGGIILYNLDEVIQETGKAFFSRLNLLREDLLDLNIPLLFWFSDQNISRLANEAADLFIRRSRGVICFPEVLQTEDTMPSLFAWSKAPGAAESFKAIFMKIEILRKQLKEAEARKYQPARIAREIVMSLLRQYLAAFMLPEAEALYTRYKQVIDTEAFPGADEIIADYYYRTGKWDESLQLYLKILDRYKISNDKRKIAATYHTIGTVYQDKGEYNRAGEYYRKSLDLSIALDDKIGMAATCQLLGIIHFQKGEYDQAGEYYQKSLEISTALDDKNRTAATCYLIGIVNFQKGEYNQAGEYYRKSLEISTALDDKNGMANTLAQLSLLYETQGSQQQALEYILRSYQLFHTLNSLSIRQAARQILALKKHFKAEDFNRQLVKAGIDPAELLKTGDA